MTQHRPPTLSRPKSRWQRLGVAACAGLVLFSSACGSTASVELLDADIGAEIPVALADTVEEIEPTEAPTVATPEPVVTPEATVAPQPTVAAEPSESPDVAQNTVFCAASRDAYESYVVLDLLPQDADTRAIAMTVDQLIEEITVALPLAPSAAEAEPVQIALDSITTVNEALLVHNYDIEIIEVAEPDAVAAFETFTEVMIALELFLAGPCGYDELTARGAADQRFEQLLAVYPPQLVNDTTYIDDNWGNIELAVPATWSEVESYDDGVARGVLVAPDLAAYDSSWNADGVMITALDISDQAITPNPAEFIELSAAQSDCAFEQAGSYSDGLYTGEIRYFNTCAGGPTQAVVVGATNAEATILVIVEVQMVNFDDAVLALILDSFVA